VGGKNPACRSNPRQDHEGTKRLAEEMARSHVTDTVVLITAVPRLAAVVVGLSAPPAKMPSPSGWIILSVIVAPCPG
jgi:hypothetical protein